MQNHLKSFLTLAAAFMLTQISTMLLIPALPTMVNILKTTTSTMMLTISIFFFGYMLGQLVWGSASDYIGRKTAIAISLILYIIISLGIMLVHSIIAFELLYTVLGFAAAAYTSVGNATLKDIFGIEKTAQAIAYIGIVMSSGILIGPVIGAHLLTWFNWQAIFIFLAIYALLTLIALIVFVPETNHKTHQQQRQPLKQAYKSVLTNKNFIAYVITLGIAFGSAFAYLDVSAFIFTKYLDFSVTSFGWINIITTVTYLLAALIIVKYVEKYGVQYLTKIGITIAVISTLLFLTITLTNYHSRTLIIIPIIGFMLGFGMILPATKAGAMTSVTENVGTAASLMKFIQTLFCVIIVAIAAHLQANISILPFAILMVVLSLLAFSLFKLTTR